jgi:hypothetical protein
MPDNSQAEAANVTRELLVPREELADFADVIGNLIGECSDPGSGALAAHYRIQAMLNHGHYLAKTPADPSGDAVERARFERDDQCNIEFGTVPDCNCPHEHWHVNGVCLDVHIEEDRSGHIILTVEDDPIELSVGGLKDFAELRGIAFAWATCRLGLAATPSAALAAMPSSNAGDRVERLHEIAREAEFLCARIDELDWCDSLEATANQHAGHVDPSVSRLKGLLSSLAAIPAAKGEGEIPAGMKPWHGGDSAPTDYIRGRVAFRDGEISFDEEGPWYWKHDGVRSDIIAYTPKPTPAPERPADLREADECGRLEINTILAQLLHQLQPICPDMGERIVRGNEATDAILQLVSPSNDALREALIQTQMMLEQIIHLKSTDFAEVARRIMAIRAALANGGPADA